MNGLRAVGPGMRGIFDWVTSPVETAKATWQNIIGQWSGVMARLQSDLDRLTDLRIQVPDEMYSAIQADWQETANALSAMEVLNDDAMLVRAWFEAHQSGNLSGLGVAPVAAATFPLVGIAYAAAAAAAVGAGLIVLNKNLPSKWDGVRSAQAQLVSQGVDPVTAWQMAAQTAAAMPDWSSNLVMIAGLIAAVYFLPGVLKGRK